MRVCQLTAEQPPSDHCGSIRDRLLARLDEVPGERAEHAREEHAVQERPCLGTARGREARDLLGAEDRGRERFELLQGLQLEVVLEHVQRADETPEREQPDGSPHGTPGGLPCGDVANVERAQQVRGIVGRVVARRLAGWLGLVALRVALIGGAGCGRLAIDAIAPSDAAPDLDAEDGSVGAPAVTMLGASETTVSGTTATLTLGATVPAGRLLVALVGARGRTPVVVTDTRLNTWMTAVEQDNSTTTATAGIYYALVTSPLDAGDTISASVSGGANTYLRTLGAVSIADVSAIDQIGQLQQSSTMLEVSTQGPAASDARVVVAAIATGNNSADQFIHTGDFTEVHHYGGTFSSGSSWVASKAALAGVPTFTATTLQGLQANYALVIATFR